MHEALYRAVDSLMSHVRQDPQRRLLKTKRIDAVLLHRIWGPPLLLAMSFGMLMLIYNGSAPYVAWLNQLTLWMQHGCRLLLASMPAWVQSLICDGLLAGIGSVLSFLPLMAFLYFFLGLLEESGYMARIAFLMDRLMRPFGCSGKAFVSFVVRLGMQCSSRDGDARNRRRKQPPADGAGRSINQLRRALADLPVVRGGVFSRTGRVGRVYAVWIKPSQRIGVIAGAVAAGASQTAVDGAGTTGISPPIAAGGIQQGPPGSQKLHP